MLLTTLLNNLCRDESWFKWKICITTLGCDQWKMHFCTRLARCQIELRFSSSLVADLVILCFLFHIPHHPTMSMKAAEISKKSPPEPPKKVRPTMCHIICLWDYNTLQSSVTGDVSDPAGDYSSLWPEQSDFFSSFSLPFLYSWRHRIILPILEWLQQRHCYSQGAVSPRCNSIHSQLDWPVIYRKSSPSEELSLHTHTGNSLSAAHDVLGLRSGQFKAASISGKGCTDENHRKPLHKGYNIFFNARYKKQTLLYSTERL